MLRIIRAPLAAFIFSRLAIFALASVFSGLWPEPSPGFWESFSQWDGQWYLRIIREGYWYKGPLVQSPVAFFPLYPLLGKGLTLFGLSPTLSLFLVSNLASLGFFVVFWQWLGEEFNRETADKALLLLAISPLSYLFSSLYADSLFLFLAGLFFWSLRKKRFGRSALWSGLAAGTRPFGIFLCLPLAWELWQTGKTRKWLGKLGLLLIASSGLLLFSIYLRLSLGEWLPFLKQNTTAWPRYWAWPWEALKAYILSLFSFGAETAFFGVGVFDLAVFLLVTGGLIYFFPKMKMAYKLYLVPVYLMSVTQPWELKYFLPSGAVSRYFLSLFPLAGFLLHWLVVKKKQWLYWGLLIFSALFFSPFALAFFHGGWVQ